MKNIDTRQDAVEAIRDLLNDLERNPRGWENRTLERYLEAMSARLESYGSKHNPSPSWELIVRMLQAGKIYE